MSSHVTQIEEVLEGLTHHWSAGVIRKIIDRDQSGITVEIHSYHNGPHQFSMRLSYEGIADLITSFPDKFDGDISIAFVLAEDNLYYPETNYTGPIVIAKFTRIKMDYEKNPHLPPGLNDSTFEEWAWDRNGLSLGKGEHTKNYFLEKEILAEIQEHSE